MRDNDEIFRKISDIYVDRYGKELQEEQQQLERFREITVPEIRLERRLREKLTAKKRRPYLRIIVPLAACFVLALLALPRFLYPGSSLSPALPSSSPISSGQPGAPTPGAPTPGTPPPAYKIIPLTASLPDGFTKTGFEQDYEKSIYYIKDAFLDDVVITLEKAPAKLDTAGLVAIDLGGQTAYGKQTDSYGLLTFKRDDVLYTLTCRYDINTLVALGNALI